MNELMILLTVLGIGLIIGSIGGVIVKNLLGAYSAFMHILETNKKFEQKQKVVDEMKSKGEFHEWQELPTPEGNLLVCVKTGWCPSANGFIDIERINSYLTSQKIQKEYKAYRDERVRLLAEKYNYPILTMEQLVEDIFSIKKDFHLLKLNELQQEFFTKAEDVETKRD